MLQDSVIILKTTLTSLLLCLFIFEGIAQNRWIDGNASHIESIEHLILPPLDNKLLKDKYKSNAEEEGQAPHIFAEAIDEDIKVTNHGSWESSANGYMLWRQRITSKDAYSLNLGFTDFYLPSSAALFIYDAKKTFIVGPVTQKDNDIHREWWSPIIPSDDVIIELQIDPNDLTALKFNLTKINHDFSGFGAVISGSCNLDVICGEPDGYTIVERFRDVINSVGMMMIQGRLQCTGSLLNNTRKDCTPYVLTAEHCGINESTAASVLIYWNFQNSQCRIPDSVESGNQGDGIQNKFNSGSSLVAKYDQSDFSLVVLDDPVDPDDNPYYAGWNNQTEFADTVFTIHHPAGGEKRISFDFDTVAFNVDRNFVQVADWDIGTTESGSSGGPLFNTAGHIIGHLSGGDAACGNDLFDDFGMFKKSWEGGGTPETRLKDWLDPLNTGQSALGGRYCTDVAIIDKNIISICTIEKTRDTLSLTATAGYEEGGQVSVISSSPGLFTTFSAPSITTDQTIDIYIEVTDDFDDSSGTINVLVENDIGPSEFEITVNVFAQIPETVSLAAPLNASSGHDFDVSFEWSNNAPSYQLEISEVPDFSFNLRTISDLTSHIINLRDFQSSTTYYWRVKAINVCGESPYSEVYSFTTGTIVCVTNMPTDLPQEIGLDPVTLTSTITIADEGTIADVNILNITGKHSWISDLTMTLTSPAGTVVTLVETPCSDENDFLVSFDDDSENVNLDCPLTTGRKFKPVETLSSFNNESANGDWILTVEDGVGDDGGSLDSWTLELCLNQNGTKRFEATPTFVTLCDKNLEPIDIDLFLSGGWNNPSLPTVSTGSGLSIPASISPDPIGSSNEISVHIEDPSDLVGESSVTITFVDDQEVIATKIPVIHISNVGRPELEIPGDGAERQSLTPTLAWIPRQPVVDSYRLIVSTDEALEEIIEDTIISVVMFTLVEELEGLTTYYWQVTTLGACADSSSFVSSFITDMKVATIDETLTSVKIYPSPATDLLTIDLADLTSSKDLIFELISTDGRVMTKGILDREITTLDVANIPPGLYLINLVSKDGNYVYKVVVSH